jgi:hypothetical protein
MAEKLVDTITAGNRPAYEILVTEKGSIRIREADHPEKYFDLIASVVPRLIHGLQAAQRIAESRP